MSGTREKFNAVFFAAIMVLSMVAFGTAFAGSAAAIDSAETTAEDIDLTAGTVTQELNFTLQNGTDYADSGGVSAETTINVSETGADLSVSGVSLDNATAVGGTSGGTDFSGTQVTETSDTANDYVNVTVDESQLTGGEANAIDITVTVTYDDGTVASDLTHTIESDGGSAGSGETDTTPTFDVLGLEITNVEPAGDQVITQGSDILYNVTVENTGANSETGVEVAVGGAGGSASNTTTAVPASGTVEFTELNPSTSNLATGDTEDATITTNSDGAFAHDTVVNTVTARDDDNALISGEITDRQNLAGIDTAVAERLEVTIVESGNSGGTTVVNSVPFSDFDTLAGNNPLVDTANFIPGETDQYSIELATFGQGSQYDITINDPQNEFSTLAGSTEPLGPGQNDDQPLRLQRNVDADRLTVLDDGEVDRIESDIGSGAVPIDPAPSSLESTSDDVDATVTLDTFTETADTTDFGTTAGELAPYDDQTGEVDVTVANVDDATFQGNVNVDPDPADTDENGTSSVDVNLDFAGAGVTPSDVSETVNVDLEFNASTNASASDTVTVSFVPDIGDTGTISGDVDEVNESIGLGVESNVESAENVPVHAVQIDSVLDNSITIEDGLSLEDAPANVDGTAVNSEDPADNVRIATDDQFRVVTYSDGEEIVQDPRSDYIVTTGATTTEVVQNETEPGFNILSEGDQNPIDVHFLQPNEYQVQQKVTLTLADNSQETRWLNATVNEAPGALGGTGAAQASANDVFDVPDDQDLTYEAIEEQFSSERAVPTDRTNSDGEFELLNLPTAAGGSQYLVVAGAGDSESADGQNRMGFANFAGYSVVDVDDNADATPSSVDLSVQQYEPLIDIQYDLDATVEDADGEQVKETNIAQGNDRTVEVQVSSSEVGANEEPTPVGAGVELDDLSLIDNPTDPNSVGSLDFDNLETNEDGVVTATFEAASAGDGTVNVTASASDDTAGGASTTGSQQAEVTVFGAATITGDVVNENGNNLPGATLRLYKNANDVDVDGAAVSTVEAGDEGSYTFIENQTSGERLQSGQDWVVEAEFDGDTETRAFNDISTGTNDGDIVIVGGDPAASANYQIGGDLGSQTATAGEETSIDVTVSNQGQAEGDQQTVEWVVGGNVVDSATVGPLDVGESETVTLTTTVPANLAGQTVGWYVQTDDDSTEDDGTSLVVLTEDGEEPTIITYAGDNGVVGPQGLGDAAADFRNGEIGPGELGDVAAAFRNGEPVL
ncbi:surface glycoprotein [Halonotius roseus]|uniref:CARDB domain-containing protein n=1 Tax=Halonotius roseus TaxID=2511997 RepID=A0A544QRI0_9EURY|nr:surface glycoprotein [Halonotius roseus]TQQ82041.1 hypothetical protein EWF95_03620 [Halonotius roseus]